MVGLVQDDRCPAAMIRSPDNALIGVRFDTAPYRLDMPKFEPTSPGAVLAQGEPSDWRFTVRRSCSRSTEQSPDYGLNWQPKPCKGSPQQHPARVSIPPSGSDGKLAASSPWQNGFSGARAGQVGSPRAECGRGRVGDSGSFRLGTPAPHGSPRVRTTPSTPQGRRWVLPTNRFVFALERIRPYRQKCAR